MPKQKAKHRNKRAPAGRTAATADRHELYQLAVQNPETEIDFVDTTYLELRGTRASRLREDFCGTAHTSCEWVRRRDDNVAIGVDLDGPTLEWGRSHNVASLPEGAQPRVTLLERNVLEPGDEASNVDIVLAMNFSYFCFETRDELCRYFSKVRETLADDGVFFLDFYGGYEAFMLQEEERVIEDEDFIYVWDQDDLNPITGRLQTYIHFHFNDGTKMRRAFSYVWRLWTLPEVQEALRDSGFGNIIVYCEGDDGEGGGDGNFEPAEVCDPDPSYICYLTAEK